MNYTQSLKTTATEVVAKLQAHILEQFKTDMGWSDTIAEVKQYIDELVAIEMATK